MATLLGDPRSRNALLVTNRSSPTSCVRSPEPLGERPPVVPGVLVEPVLDGDERVAVDEILVEADHLLGGEAPALGLEHVGAVAEDLARRRVERDRDPLAVTGSLGGLEDHLDRGLGGLEVRREAALVPDAGREPALVQHRLQVMEDLRAEPKRLGERLRPGRDDHELLEVEPVLGVRAAVDDVHERHRERARFVAADPAVEREPRRPPRRPWRRRASTPRIAFAPSRALVGVPSSSTSFASSPR